MVGSGASFIVFEDLGVSAEGALLGTGWTVQRYAQLFPDFLHVSYEMIDHVMGMEWCGCQTQFLLSASDSWIVDSLDIVSVLLHQNIRDLGAHERIAELNWYNVRWSVLHGET